MSATVTKVNLPTGMYAQRIAVCRTCDERRELPAGVLQCLKCGCVMSMKARFPGAKCPLGKW